MARFIMAPVRASRNAWRHRSPFTQGVLTSTVLTALFTGALLLVVRQYSFEPSADFLRTFATVTATLLVAYAVSASWLMQTMLRRNGKKERSATMAGWLSALGTFALIGIGIALVYADIVSSPHNIVIGQVLTSFAFASALLPMALVAWQASNEYELHREQNPDDED